MKTVTDMTTLRSLIGRQRRFDVAVVWNRLLKRTIGRFVRGNIAAQNLRIMLPDEQKKQHERARSIAEKWRNRR